MPFLFSKHVITSVNSVVISHQSNAYWLGIKHSLLQYLHYFQRQTDRNIEHDQNTPFYYCMVRFDQTVFFNFASECKMHLNIRTTKVTNRSCTLSPPSAAQCALYTLCTQANEQLNFAACTLPRWLLQLGYATERGFIIMVDL